jgi:hypothetical protein
MKTMSSKEIKDRYGLFTETARRELVVHTSHGRPTLVTLSIDRAREIPEINAELAPAQQGKRVNVLLEALGKGEHLSAYATTDEADAAIRRERDEWR